MLKTKLEAKQKSESLSNWTVSLITVGVLLAIKIITGL